MGLRVSNLRNNTKTVQVKVDDDTVFHVEYRPLAMNAQQQEAFEAMLEAKQYTPAMVDMLTGVLSHWYLLDDNDEPIPVTKEHILQTIPVRVSLKVMETVLQDMYPNPKSEGSFGDG